jgi:O-methyltransferase
MPSNSRASKRRRTPGSWAPAGQWDEEARLMRDEDYVKLLEDTQHELLAGAGPAGVLGLTPVTLGLLASLVPSGLYRAIEAVYTPQADDTCPALIVPVRPFQALGDARCGVLVVAADAEKEDLLCAALPFIVDAPKVIVAGYEHLGFRDAVFDQEQAQLLVPSLANGYPNSLVHLYQCLANAARLSLSGVVAEFGMFKGGTTMFPSKVIERLGATWPVIGFDTFGGFPPRRSPLDMYDHPGCVFTDLPAVRRYLDGRDVQIIAGDITETCGRLEGEDLVLTFIDTDNYTPSRAALEVVRERTVTGGAIVFDHFTGTSRFRYTLGERIAGRVLLDDPRWFHLHGTGVFYRQGAAR